MATRTVSLDVIDVRMVVESFVGDREKIIDIVEVKDYGTSRILLMIAELELKKLLKLMRLLEEVL